MKLKISSSLGRRDEQPNIELAEQIVNTMDKSAVAEIINGIGGFDNLTANDCIKVAYEIGYRSPGLIAEYADVFIRTLKSRSNRLVWGAMTALSTIAELKAGLIFSRMDVIMESFKNGSVITVDNAVSVFAGLAKAGKEYEKQIFPLIINHLKTCRPKEVPQHAERYLPALTSGTKAGFIDALTYRLPDLSDSGRKRIDKVLKEAGSK